jgi:biopolymer transport protein TolR
MELRRKRRKPMAEINVVPYIDVMLVLLIVFMVTAPLLTQGLKVDLPPASSEPLERDENTETLVISITAENEFYLSLGAVAEEDQQSVTLDLIADQVGKIVNANPGIQIFVEGDDSAGYGSFIRLMTVLQNAGIESPNLVTRPLDSL